MDFTPHTEKEIKEMLEVIGVSSLSDLFSTVPSEVVLKDDLKLAEPLSEADLLRFFREVANYNQTVYSTTSFLGGGAYNHYCPSAINHILSRGEFYTAYTPYQPEVSQGTLQAQFEYQTMIASILGMDVSNASMYEGATAVAEACLLALRYTKKRKIVISKTINPQYRDVIRTYVDCVIEVKWDETGGTDLKDLETKVDDDTACVVIQSPNFFGVIEDVELQSSLAHKHNALMVVTFTEALAFGLIESPGKLGADIAAGEGQSLGLPLSFGGPYIGLFAVKQPLFKSMPGRIIGQTRDSKGRRCYCLTFAAREQHIRRARATSNICTNQGLCAIAVAIYLSLLGKVGFQRLARYNHYRAEKLKEILKRSGKVVETFSGPTFNEFVVRLVEDSKTFVQRCLQGGIVPGLQLDQFYPELKNCLLITVTEQNSDQDFEKLERML